MDEATLKDIIKRQFTTAASFMGGEISEDRGEAMDLYLGKPLGNEVAGRSQVVSTDVQDVIESVMPDIMQIFAAGDQVIRFDPVQEEDEEQAKQATEYTNHIFMVDNDGFNVLHDWFKDALLQINGIIKIWWDDSEKKTRETLTGFTGMEVAKIDATPGVEIIEHDEYWSDGAKQMAAQMGIDLESVTDEMIAMLPPEMQELSKLHDLTIIRTEKKGRVRIENVPPEEFFVSRRARSIDDAPFVCHEVRKTVSELIEDGYDAETINAIPTESDTDYNDEEIKRNYRENEYPQESTETDKTMREINVRESYVRLDWDGDGVAELRKVTTAGPGYVVLDNEPVSMVPFCGVTPIRMPHKFFGRSLTDLVKDIQMMKTAVWRQLLDNMYNVNNGRLAISGKVSIEDVLDNKVGAPIRVDTQGADVAGHMVPVQTSPIGPFAYPLLEYIDSVRETRVGVTRYSQGMDADSLNKTAKGISMILGQAQKRTLLIARVFAEGGVRDAFKKVLKLTIDHQDKPRVIRLRNKWVPMDPRSWNAEMDVSINVGLGHGTQDQRAAMLGMVLQVMEKVVAYQGGVEGPLVGIEQIRNAVAKLIEASGFKNAEQFIREVDPNTPLPERKDPEMAKVEAQMQLESHKTQLKLASDEKIAQDKIAIEQARDASQMQLEQQKANGMLLLEREKMILEHQRKLMEMGLDFENERIMNGVEIAHKQAMANLKIGETVALTAIKARSERERSKPQ